MHPPTKTRTQETRLHLWKEVWTPDLAARGIPTTPGCDPLAMLTSDGHTAQMVREGLPGTCICMFVCVYVYICVCWTAFGRMIN